jgi:hypothetical protein
MKGAQSDMATRGRRGGLTTAMRHDPAVYTAAARAAFNNPERWLKDIPTDLPHEERLRRAEAARKLHFSELGRRSGKARRRSARGKGVRRG